MTITASFYIDSDGVIGVVADVPTDEAPPRTLFMTFPLPLATQEEYERISWPEIWELAPDDLPIFDSREGAESFLQNAYNLVGLLGPSDAAFKLIYSFADMLGVTWVPKTAIHILR